MKWGGILTQTGRKQAMNLGEYFRKNMYGSMNHIEVEERFRQPVLLEAS